MYLPVESLPDSQIGLRSLENRFYSDSVTWPIINVFSVISHRKSKCHSILLCLWNDTWPGVPQSL